MSSMSPASSKARMVLYRHMCCEPAVKTNVSPLRETVSLRQWRESWRTTMLRGDETHSGRTTGAQSLRARKKTGLEKSGVGTVYFGFWRSAKRLGLAEEQGSALGGGCRAICSGMASIAHAS